MNADCRIPYVLTVSGFDSSGCAGLQMDNRAIHAVGAMPLNVPTAWTVQTPHSMLRCRLANAEDVQGAMRLMLDAYPISAIKIGMLGNAAIVQSVVAVLEEYPRIFTVLDPVLVASSGADLLDVAGREFMNTALIPLVNLVTPNLDEASKLELKNAAASLVKGGHGAEVQCVDRLQIGQEAPIELSCARIVTSNNRGTGCALSSSIAAYMAHGEGLISACQKAKAILHQALGQRVQLKFSGAGPAL